MPVSPKAPKTQVTAEREVKIHLSRSDLEKVFLALTKPAPVKKTISHKYTPRAYFDTADLSLYKAGISLRVQYSTGKGGALGGYAQTLKFDMGKEGAQQAGMFFRKECENAVPSHLPDFSKLTDAEAKEIIKSFKNKKMIYLFTAAVERRFFLLTVGKGREAGTVELAFDVGELILSNTNKRYPFVEIELELIKGNPKALQVLQKKIERLAPSARPQSLSKAQQGSRLYQKHAE